MVNLQAGTSLNVIKRYWYIAITLLLLMGFATLHIPFVSQKVQSYAISSTENMFGGRSLAGTQEQKIRDISQKMGVTQTINIRKMNSEALKRYGYHNAFAYYPMALFLIPLGNQAFMYISEGFFEDLTEQEQIFLIGHELVHIKENHTKWLALLLILDLILISLFVWLLRKKMRSLVTRWFPNYAKIVFWGMAIGVWLAIASVFDVGMLAYMKHNERVADIQALEKLACHGGLLKITDRWQREFKMPLHNDYYGIFTDHPSCAERQAYCLELQQKTHKEL